MSPWGPLRERDPHAVEDMDRPDCDLQRLNRSYARFPVVNYLLSGWHRTYRERLRPIQWVGLGGILAGMVAIGLP